MKIYRTRQGRKEEMKGELLVTSRHEANKSDQSNIACH